MSKYCYIDSEPGLWTVGFYKPDGKFDPESDHDSEDSASRRVRFLNGGAIDDEEKIVQMCVDGFDTGSNLFCLTSRGRIFVRSAGSGKKEWLLLDMPTMTDNVKKFKRF